MVAIQLVEILVPGRQIFRGLDLAILVVVVLNRFSSRVFGLASGAFKG